MRLSKIFWTTAALAGVAGVAYALQRDMKKPDQSKASWNSVDETSEASFPASDAPSWNTPGPVGE